MKWAGTTYGNGWMHKWLIRILRVLDMRILYAFVDVFVIPVVLVVNPSCGITYRYFRKRLGLSIIKAAWNTYRNHCQFAEVVIDKFAMYAGKRFKIEIDGFENFSRLVDEKDGFVLLSSHIGNYEIAGYTLRTEKKHLNALVYAGEKASVMANRNKLFSETNISMIAIKGDMSHLFEINNALSNGDIVSMPADRISGSNKSIELDFLGANAKFPKGPFVVATSRGLNVLAVSVMKKSLKKYKIYVTPLTYNKEAGRNEQIQELSKAYVAELGKRVREYPTQWYNYFEFWS